MVRIFSFIVLLMASMAFGDNITGYVRDGSGIGISGATVTGLAPHVWSYTSAVTPKGYFMFTATPPLTQDIQVSMTGYTTRTVSCDIPLGTTLVGDIVLKKIQTITFPALSDRVFGESFYLTATASSGLPVSYTSSNTSVATVSGNFVTIVGVGSTTITAFQTGNASWSPATSVGQPLTVTKATATLRLFNVSQVYNGTPRAISTTTTPSGLNVSVLYDGSSTVPTNVGSYAITATINEANYQGSTSGTSSITKATATITLNNLSQTYNGTPRVISATTTPTGLGVSVLYDGSSTAPTNAGSYAVVGTISDANYQGSASGTLTIGKASQSISFGALSGKTYGDGPFNLTATASSGLPVSFSSSNTLVATVSGNQVTIVGVGSANITASQAGNGNYNPATDVVQGLSVSKATATVTLGNLSAVYDGTVKNATATTSPTGLVLSFTYSLSPVNAGSYSVTATINDVNYQGSAAGTLVISKAPATVTLSNLDQTYNGSPKSVTVTTAPTGLTVGVTYNGSSTVPSAVGSYAIVATVNELNYAGSASGTLHINSVVKTDQTITFGTLSDRAYGSGNFTLNATATSGLSVSFLSSNASVATVSGNTVTITGIGTTTITATQAGNGSYNPAPDVQQSLTITKATAMVVLSGLTTTYDGNAKVASVSVAPAGLSVAVTYNGLFPAPSNAGSYAVVATVNDVNYLGSASGTLLISKASQTIVFDVLATKRVGDAPFTLTATAPGGMVSFASSNASVATVSGSTVTIVGAGSTTITASQAGNGNYNPATDVQRTLTVDVAPDNVPPTVVLSSPVLDAVWSSPSAHDIVWTASDNVGVTSRTISFSGDSGKTWKVLSTSAGTSPYGWLIQESPTNKAFLRVTAYDAMGNNSSAQVRFCVAGKPVFTSPDTAVVKSNTAFSYKVTYQIPGNPLTYKDTVLQKPGWLNVLGDSLYGKAPARGTDTVKVRITAGSMSTTLVLLIRIKVPTKTLVSLLAGRDCFGINQTVNGIRFGANAGAYKIFVYDISGRVVFSRGAVAGENFFESLPMKSCNAYMAKLLQGDRSLIKKIQITR